jgi:hypothetical protein
MVVMLTGCMRQSEPPRRFLPGEPLYEQFTTRGSRVIVEGQNEEVLLKVRERRFASRVYDHKMTPVGKVRPLDDDQIEQQSRDAQTRHQTGWVNEDIAELPEHWRVERADGGWDVFGPDAQLLALWRFEDQAWTMKDSYGAPHTQTIRQEDHLHQVLSHQDQVLLSTRADWSDLKLFALTLEELPPLPRYALALWADKNLDPPHAP